MRYLQSSESRIKKASTQKDKIRHDWKKTQQHQIRKQPTSGESRPTKISKTPKIYFSHVPKYRSTNIDTVDTSAFFSLFHKEIFPIDDPT